MASEPNRTRERVRALLDRGLTQAAVARELGLTPAAVSYHAKRLGRPRQTACARRYDWSEIQAHYDAGHSITQCQERFGFSRKTFHDAVLRGAVVTRPRAMPLAQLLVAGTYRGRDNLKARIVAAGLKDGSCEECGITDWRGRPLSMAFHHVNGDGRDNRLENLRLLCPNCHSQTENFAGKGVVRSIRPAA